MWRIFSLDKWRMSAFICSSGKFCSYWHALSTHHIVTKRQIYQCRGFWANAICLWTPSALLSVCVVRPLNQINWIKLKICIIKAINLCLVCCLLWLCLELWNRWDNGNYYCWQIVSDLDMINSPDFNLEYWRHILL